MLFKDFLENSINDLRRFFKDGFNFKVNVLERESTNHISVKGAGDDKKIAISRDMANFEINDPIDYLMSLMIVGHEMAHCLCEHNKFNDTGKMDGIAIEGYADYFGARITYSLLNFGKFNFNEFTKLYDGMPFSSRSNLNRWLARGEIFRVTGLALDRLNNGFYKSADGTGKYPHSETRVLTFIAGVMSFFYRYQGKISQNNFLNIFLKIFDGCGFLPSSSSGTNEHIERIGEIHSIIQGDSERITYGISGKYDNILSTKFDVSNESIKRRLEVFRKMFSSWDSEFSENIMGYLQDELEKRNS